MKYFFLLLVTFFNILTAVELTPKEKDFIKNNPEIILGIGYGWEPLAINTEDGKISGFKKDLLDYVNKITNANFVLKIGNWADIQKQAREGKIHGLASLAQTSLREKEFLFSSTIFKLDFGIYTTLEKLQSIKSKEDLRTVILATEKNNAVHKNIINKYNIENLLFVENLEESYRKVFDNKADIAIGYNGFQFKLAKQDLPILFNTNIHLSSIDLKAAIRKDIPEAMSILQKGLDQIPLKTVDLLKEKWQIQDNTNDTFLYESLTHEEKNWLKNKPTLNLAYPLIFKPLFMKNEDKYEGLAVDIYELIAKRLGININYVVIDDWKNAINKVAKGDFDFIPMMAPALAKENGLLITNSIFDIRTIIYGKSNLTGVNSIEDLKNKRVAYNKNVVVLHRFLEKYKDNVKLIPLASHDEVFRFLNDRKVDAAIAFNTSNYILKKQLFTDIKPIHTLKEPIVKAVSAISPNQPILHSIFSKAVNQLSIDERFLISEKWVGFDENEKELLTADEKEYLENNTFTICEQIDIYPLSGVQNNQIVGIRGDYIKELANKIGLKYNVLGSNSIEDLKYRVKSKQCDIMASLGSGQRVFPDMLNTNTVMEFPYAMLGDVKSFNLRPFSDLSNKKLIVRFENIKERILSVYPQLDVEVINEIKTAMSKVGKDTYFIVLRPIAERIIQDYGFDKYKINGVLNRVQQETTMGVYKENDKLLKILNKTISKIEPSFINNIKDKYTIKQFTVVSYKFLWYVVAILVIILIVVLITYSVKMREKVISTKEDNQKLSKTKNILEKKVITDKLTGAYNREYFYQNINELLDDAKKQDSSLAISYIDIDHFKDVNDNYGHDIGDIVLKEMAYIIQRYSRRTDTFVRWGGEEFILILIVNSNDSLRRVLEHLRQVIEHHKFPHIGFKTCSFGGTLHTDNEDIDLTISRADKALYEAKENGRNQVVIK